MTAMLTTKGCTNATMPDAKPKTDQSITWHDVGVRKTTVYCGDISTLDAKASQVYRHVQWRKGMERYGTLKQRTTPDAMGKTTCKRNETTANVSAKISMNVKAELLHYWPMYDLAWLPRPPQGRTWHRLDAWLQIQLISTMRSATNCKSQWRNSHYSSWTMIVYDGMKTCERGCQDVGYSNCGGLCKTMDVPKYLVVFK